MIVSPSTLLFFPCSYVLYEVSKPDKNGCPMCDLSDDNEAQPIKTFDLNTSDMRFARVLTKAVSVASHFRPVINSRLLALIRSKLWRMGKALTSKSTPQRKRIFQNWQKSDWIIEFKASEVRSVVMEENARLQRKIEQAKLEAEKLQKEKGVTEVILGEIVNENASLCKELTSEKSKNEQLQTKLETETCARLPLHSLNGSVARPQKRKSWEEYTNRHKKRKIRELKDKVSELNDRQFEVTAVHVRNKDTGNSETVCTADGMQIAAEAPQSNTDLKKVLLVKERYGISNQAYHELSMLDKHLPRSCKIQKEVKQINDRWEIFPTPGDSTGAQQSFVQRLSERIRSLIRSANDIRRSHKVRVKLTGDGTYIGSRQHIVTFGFTLLDEGDRAHSPNGNYTVCIFRDSESYECLSICLRDVISEVDLISRNGITVDEQKFDVDFYLGADWKFLATVCGIDSPNCTYACIWCTCPNNERYDSGNTNWSLTDPSKGARTVESISRASRLPAKSRRKFNCSRLPLFPMVPISRVVIDNLHLYLRITDNLINLLITDLRRLDGIEKSTNVNLSETSNLKKYESFLAGTCKINFHFYTCNDTGSLKWRDLTGPEKYSLFNRIDIVTLFPNLPNAVILQKLWKEFASLNESIRSESMATFEITAFEEKVKLWLELFLQVYQTKHVTPYMHALVAHLPEFLTIYGSIIPFTQQGLERLNDQYTHYYFRGTNHRDYEALKQLLLKKNRIELLTDQGCVRQKESQVHVCSCCRKTGHNKRTCSSQQ